MTIRWTFRDGPTAGQEYEHRISKTGRIAFRQAGSKSWARAVDGAAATFAECAVVSYLSSHGYTLTAILDFHNDAVLAYASNEKDWTAQHGTFKVVPQRAKPRRSTSKAR